MLRSLLPDHLHTLVIGYFHRLEAGRLVRNCIFDENANWNFVEQYIPAKSILDFTEHILFEEHRGEVVAASLAFLSFSPLLRDFLWKNYQDTLVRRLCCRRKAFKDWKLVDYEAALHDSIWQVIFE